MKKRYRIYLNLLFVMAIVVVAVFVDLPNGPYLKIGKKIWVQKEIKIKEGLDLQGGARVVYEADLSKLEDTRKTEAMNALSLVIENRINAFGVSEPIIQTSKVGDSYRLTVEMPGVKDLDEATKLIGKTAELEFKETNATGDNFQPTGLTGKDFKQASVSFDQAGQAQIDIVFSDEGGNNFAEITKRNVGKPLAIYLDGQMISAPTVNQEIIGGRGVITGKFDVKEAKNLAIQLNAGALPVPVKMIQTQSVGASLGREALRESIYAGVVGLIFVVSFMVVYYRVLGIFSSIGLFLYGIFMLAIIKIFGVTLTMSGVAGLILTVGMSVETDILVFERIRERLRAGIGFEQAVRQGFKKTWPTLWDSNAVTLIIAALLYTVGGAVRGFALVMSLGIFVGLFTTFIYTRIFLNILVRYKFFRKHAFFAVKKSEVSV